MTLNQTYIVGSDVKYEMSVTLGCYWILNQTYLLRKVWTQPSYGWSRMIHLLKYDLKLPMQSVPITTKIQGVNTVSTPLVVPVVLL